MSESIDSYEDVIDVRDIIERVEELEDAEDDEDMTEEDARELSTLRGLLGDLRGYGGDHEWRGDWYPVSLIRDSYFTEYAQELADDIGAVPREYSWPASYIDWERAAADLQMDYSCVEYEGVTYWYYR